MLGHECWLLPPRARVLNGSLEGVERPSQAEWVSPGSDWLGCQTSLVPRRSCIACVPRNWAFLHGIVGSRRSAR